ncbi:ABC transporter substrate-binding protein [Paenibacillus sp. LHD-117]|uniref:ABC transporter substrate-binding protein n=1 Tax=Paenibacillus sp. LHD-117 TaxID=3071412 RepID=UPI0027DEABE9|nr:ABC transporter substrate-binding protein [Paenibacillus sp. LHD-117]MDQ6421596.1 ABC transporter substrate-binding protein [Paenibacillus sp. LHD-117]
MKTRNKWSMKPLLGMLMVVLMLALAACSGNNGNSEVQSTNAAGEPTATVQPESTESASSETTYPLTVVDATGTELVLEQAPTAVVSLAPSETETIYAIGAGDVVVGVDDFSNYPPEAAQVAKVGDMTTNIEAVAALNPDLVLASSTMNADAVTKLRELGIPVYATDPKSYDEVVAKVEELGKMMNRSEDAAKTAGQMRDTLALVTEAVKDAEKKKVYLEFSPGWTVGSGEFLDELITLAGGTNISASMPGWFEVNAEEVIKQNPQLIIYPEMGEEKSSIVAGIEARPGWEAIDAVKNKAMIAVTNDPLVRVGPRLADGLLELAKAIHPELVK